MPKIIENKSLKVVENKKIWFSISILVVVIGLAFTLFRGLNFGIDFIGGHSIILQYNEKFDKATVDKIVRSYADDAITNTVEKNQYQIKSSKLTTTKFSELYQKLKANNGVTKVVSQNEIEASVGTELKISAIKALLIAFVAILLYIAFRFELNYGLAVLIALVHDVLTTISVYAVFNLPINAPFIAAVLTIVGYSIIAAIVIFDRVRENSKGVRNEMVPEIVDKSINQTIARSINTTLATLFMIVPLLVFVASVRTFALPITIGIVSGLYSSIFVAPSIYCVIKKKFPGKKKLSVAK